MTFHRDKERLLSGGALDSVAWQVDVLWVDAGAPTERHSGWQAARCAPSETAAAADAGQEQ